MKKIIMNEVLIDLLWAVVGLLLGLLIGVFHNSPNIPQDLKEDWQYCIDEEWGVCVVEYDTATGEWEVLGHE